MKHFLSTILILFSVGVVSSCQMNYEPEQEKAQPTLRLFTSQESTDLRSLNGGEVLTLFGSDAEGDWHSRAVLRGNEWIMTPPKEIKSAGHLFGVVSSSGDVVLTPNEYGALRIDLPAVTTGSTDGYLYTAADYSPESPSVRLLLKRLSVRISVSLDLSDYLGEKHIEKVRVLSAPHTAWINPETAVLTRLEDSPPFEIPIERSALGDSFNFSFDTFPAGENNAPVLDVYMDGRCFRVALMSLSGRPWSAGEYYSQRVKISDYGTAVDMSDDPMPSSRTEDKIDLIDDFDAPFFTATVTDQQWHTFYRGHTSLINLFVNNYSDSDFEGDVRWVLEDLSGRVVDQGPFFSSFHIDRGKYEGLPLPIRPKVSAGRYRLRLLMRGAKSEKWFRPFVASDTDEEKDWYVDVLDESPVLLSGLVLRDGERPGYGTVSELTYGTRYIARLDYNNYRKKPVRATIKAYYERDLVAGGHSLYQDGFGVWSDCVGSVDLTLAPVSGSVDVPYEIATRRPNASRFCGYVYFTIAYDGDPQEYTLLADRNALYAMSVPVLNVSGDGLTLAKLLAGVRCVQSAVVVLNDN